MTRCRCRRSQCAVGWPHQPGHASPCGRVFCQSEKLGGAAHSAVGFDSVGSLFEDGKIAACTFSVPAAVFLGVKAGKPFLLALLDAPNRHSVGFGKVTA